MEKTPSPFAEGLVLKFRHSLNVRHEHAILAAMISVNVTLQYIVDHHPESTQAKYYEDAFKRLNEMMTAHFENEMKTLQES